mgnify:CR=1 FL=1
MAIPRHNGAGEFVNLQKDISLNTFPENVSRIYPLMLEPCLPDSDTAQTVSSLQLDEPDNITCCELLAPLATQFYHCGTLRHESGYDCNVELLPLAPLTEHLKGLAPSSLVEQLRKICQRWHRVRAEYVRLTLPRRQRNFDISRQIWGHEVTGPSPELQQRAMSLTSGLCDFCSWHNESHVLIFRDGNPENQADNNLGVACPVCIWSQHLDRLGANDGVMIYLPELAPADISHLLRTTLIARRDGDERQKAGATLVLRWLAEHRRETEAFWGTSHPGEFGLALMHATDQQREDLQHRLQHIALIPNPDLINSHASPAAPAPDTWLSLLNQYRSQF